MWRVFIVVLSAVFFAVTASAQVQVEGGGDGASDFVQEEPILVEDNSSRLDEIPGLFDGGGVLADGTEVGVLPLGHTLSDEARSAIDAYTVSYYENLTRGLGHRQKVFQWQFTSSIVIFYVVIGIVLIGLYFSWMQFHRANGEVGETTLDVSKEGFKVSSPVLGVIILVLSLAFFYLYLVHVYPISELG